MRNHWLQVYKKKNKQLWTAEFSKNAIYQLKPRRVEIDSSTKLGFMSSGGFLSIIFKDARFSTGDPELTAFVSKASYDKLLGYVSRIRMYNGLEEKENYELTHLCYTKMTSGQNPDDLVFTFNFNYMRHFYVS